MDFEQLYCELTSAGIDPVLKNGKVYFNGEYNGKNFVRYIYQNKDTLSLVYSFASTRNLAKSKHNKIEATQRESATVG